MSDERCDICGYEKFRHQGNFALCPVAAFSFRPKKSDTLPSELVERLSEAADHLDEIRQHEVTPVIREACDALGANQRLIVEMREALTNIRNKSDDPNAISEARKALAAFEAPLEDERNG